MGYWHGPKITEGVAVAMSTIRDLALNPFASTPTVAPTLGVSRTGLWALLAAHFVVMWGAQVGRPVASPHRA
jgi:hypothetical protein